MIKVVCIVNHSLKNFVGHHFEYIRALIPALNSRQMPTVILANRQALPEFENVFGLERVFRRSHYDWPCRIWKVGFIVNLWILNRSYYHDLEKSLRGRVKADWLVLGLNVNHLELFGLAWWLRKIPSELRPQIRILPDAWYYFHPSSRNAAFVARIALRYLERFPSVRLVTENEGLVEAYSCLSRVPVDLIPFPQTELASGATTVTTSGRARVVFLGGARSEKGFPLLAEATMDLANLGVELAVQCNLDPGDTDAAKALARLGQQESPYVRLFTEPLTSVAYSELLASADIVLLPYRKEDYRLKPSGILVEALAAGKPVVVTAGTWLAEQVIKSKTGVIFEDGSVSGLIQAIREIVSSLDQYRQRAIEYRIEWLRFHNADRFVEKLLS